MQYPYNTLWSLLGQAIAKILLQISAFERQVIPSNLADGPYGLRIDQGLFQFAFFGLPGCLSVLAKRAVNGPIV